MSVLTNICCLFVHFHWVGFDPHFLLFDLLNLGTKVPLSIFQEMKHVRPVNLNNLCSISSWRTNQTNQHRQRAFWEIWPFVWMYYANRPEGKPAQQWKFCCFLRWHSGDIHLYNWWIIPCYWVCWIVRKIRKVSWHIMTYYFWCTWAVSP